MVTTRGLTSKDFKALTDTLVKANEQQLKSIIALVHKQRIKRLTFFGGKNDGA